MNKKLMLEADVLDLGNGQYAPMLRKIETYERRTAPITTFDIDYAMRYAEKAEEMNLGNNDLDKIVWPVRM